MIGTEPRPSYKDKTDEGKPFPYDVIAVQVFFVFSRSKGLCLWCKKGANNLHVLQISERVIPTTVYLIFLTGLVCLL